MLNKCFSLPLTSYLIALVAVPWQLSASELPTSCVKKQAHIVIMVDSTGSIDPNTELSHEKEAVKSILDYFGAQGAKHLVSVGYFGRGWVGAPADADGTFASKGIIESSGKLTDNYQQLMQYVDTIPYMSTNTNVQSDLFVAQQELDTNPSDLEVIILISDGQANVSSLFNGKDGMQNAKLQASSIKASGSRIISIGYDVQGVTLDFKTGRQLLAEIASNNSVDNTLDDGDTAITQYELTAENADGDDFYISPTTNELTIIMNSIVQSIECFDGDVCTLDICNDLTGQCEYPTVADNIAECVESPVLEDPEPEVPVIEPPVEEGPIVDEVIPEVSEVPLVEEVPAVIEELPDTVEEVPDPVEPTQDSPELPSPQVAPNPAFGVAGGRNCSLNPTVNRFVVTDMLVLVMYFILQIVFIWQRRKMSEGGYNKK